MTGPCGLRYATSVAPTHWGYRRAHVQLGETGWAVNRKLVQRLWRVEDLRLPARRRKRQRLGSSTIPADRLVAEHPDHVGVGLQFDQTLDGRRLKLLNVVDEHTREALAITVERRIDADATVAVLDGLVAERGTAPSGPTTGAGHRRLVAGPTADDNWRALWQQRLG